MSNRRNVVQQINEQKDFLLDSANSLLEWYMFNITYQFPNQIHKDNHIKVS